MPVTEEKERVANYRCVYVTEITDALHFYTQDVETGERRRDLPEPSAVGKPPPTRFLRVRRIA